MPTLPDLPLTSPDLTDLTDLTGRPTNPLSSDLHNEKATHAGPPLDVGRAPRLPREPVSLRVPSSELLSRGACGLA